MHSFVIGFNIKIKGCLILFLPNILCVSTKQKSPLHELTILNVEKQEGKVNEAIICLFPSFKDFESKSIQYSFWWEELRANKTFEIGIKLQPKIILFQSLQTSLQMAKYGTWSLEKMRSRIWDGSCELIMSIIIFLNLQFRLLLQLFFLDSICELRDCNLGFRFWSVLSLYNSKIKFKKLKMTLWDSYIYILNNMLYILYYIYLSIYLLLNGHINILGNFILNY